MNVAHRLLCRSNYWKNVVERKLLPWALDGVDLGARVLEVGPGPGVTTDLLRRRVPRLTCVEIDRGFASALGARMPGSNVRVVCGDATAMPLAGGTFDSALSFTMLHHVPSPALQDRLLAEVARVLRPGGVFAGTDSRYSLFRRLLHVSDTMVLVDPESLADRLRTAGFSDVRVEATPTAFRFAARR